MIAAVGVLVALTVGAIGSPALAGGLTSPPTVGATHWTNANAPSASGQNRLNAVSCATSTFCVAVGQQDSGAGGGTLVEQWNGSSWAVVPSVNAPSSSGDELDSVSCVGPAFCMAVGTSGQGAVAETWNGASWSLANPVIPSSVTGGAVLSSVSCVSTTVCEALGTGYNATPTPVVFGNQWNGSVWSLVSAATPSVSGSFPTPVIEATGMDCVTATWCVTVGTTNANATATTPFAEQWNGSSWSLVSVAVPSGAGVIGSYLASVSCVGTAFCEAVGQTIGATGQNLIENWNGSQWAIVTSPDTSPTQNQGLKAVDCFSQTTCSAVGSAAATTGPSPASLALEWDGSSWSIVSNTPNQGSIQTTLAGESCLTDWACVAVGVSYSAPLTPAAFAMSAPIARSGYRFVASDGGIFSYGAPFLGSTGGMALNKPIVGMAVMPGGDGYYLVASDGGIFNYGSAQFYGSMGGQHLNKPIVGMAVTGDGGGYWLVASDGGIFSFGDAQFYGSTGSLTLNKPIVGMATTPNGLGYYLVASDGGIFNYGNAAFEGSAGSLVLNKPVVGMSVPVSGGYYLVASDGGIFSYPSTLPFYGSTGSIALNKPVVGMASVAGGYYFVAADGGIFSYPSTLPFLGSRGGQPLNAPIMGMAA